MYNPSDPLNGVLSTLTKFELGAGYWVRTGSAFNNTVSGYLGGDLSVSLDEGGTWPVIRAVNDVPPQISLAP